MFDNGRGGIGVMDDGPFDPGQVVGGSGTTPATNVPANRDIVANNVLWANYAGCAIVIAAFNAGEKMQHDVVARNVVIGTTNPGRGTGFGPHGAPDVGGIVVQTNARATTISDIRFVRNIVTNSAEAGIIVHAAAPGSETRNVSVVENMLYGNNSSPGRQTLLVSWSTRPKHRHRERCHQRPAFFDGHAAVLVVFDQGPLWFQ